MRRPTFERWIRRKILQLAGASSFNFRKLVARAQQPDVPAQLSAALLLYAIETGCVERLCALVWNDGIEADFESVLKSIGSRKIERLALRGTPMMTLPIVYREILEEFADAYHTPERNAAEKRTLWQQARDVMLHDGISPASAARATGLDPANVTSFLNNCDLGRLTVDGARTLANYFEQEARESE